MSKFVTCNRCGCPNLSWQTAKSGVRYLAKTYKWYGSEGGKATFYPAHYCDDYKRSLERQAQIDEAKQVKEQELLQMMANFARGAQLSVADGTYKREDFSADWTHFAWVCEAGNCAELHLKFSKYQEVNS